MSGVVKGVKRVFKAVGKAIKNIAKSPVFKAIVIAAVAYFTFGTGTSLFAAPEVVATDALLVESVPVAAEAMMEAPAVLSAAEMGAATETAFASALETIAEPIIEEGLAAVPEIASADVATAAGEAAGEAAVSEATATAAEEVATTATGEATQSAAVNASANAGEGVVEQAITTGTDAAQVAPQVGAEAATTAESTVNAVTQAAAEGTGQAANIGQGIIDQSIGMQNVANSGVLDSVPQFAMNEPGIIDQMTSIWKGLSNLERAAVIKGAGSGLAGLGSAYEQGRRADQARADRLSRGTPQDISSWWGRSGVINMGRGGR